MKRLSGRRLRDGCAFTRIVKNDAARYAAIFHLMGKELGWAASGLTSETSKREELVYV